MGAIHAACKIDSTVSGVDNAWHDSDVMLDFRDISDIPNFKQTEKEDPLCAPPERDLHTDELVPVQNCPFSNMAQEHESPEFKRCPFSKMAQENMAASKELEAELAETLSQDRFLFETSTQAPIGAQGLKQDAKKKESGGFSMLSMKGEPSEKQPRNDVHSDGSTKATICKSPAQKQADLPYLSSARADSESDTRRNRSHSESSPAVTDRHHSAAKTIHKSSTRKRNKGSTRPKSSQPKPVPFVVTNRHYEPTEATEALFDSIGGMDRLVSLMSRFYGKMFMDAQLSKFVVAQTDPHAERLALWVAEKMTGDPVWTCDLSDRFAGQPRSRAQAHLKAWNCSKRGERHGQKFKLDDTVIWMRLMFWSCREEGLNVEPFFSWYVEFIRHFIRIYERSAPAVAWSCAEWSANATHTLEYEKGGFGNRRMNDVDKLRPKSVTSVAGSNVE